MKNFTLLIILLVCYSCMTNRNNSVNKDTEFKDTTEIVGDPTLTPRNIIVPFDNDGEYDYFPDSISGYLSYHMTIYNRHGDTMYCNDVIQFGPWNGRVLNTGSKCLQDEYFIYIMAIKENGEEEEISTTCHLIIL